MNCVVWNARGLGSTRAFHELRRLIADSSPGLVFLSETKLVRNKYLRWKVELGFDGLFNVDASGNSGGLALMWRAPHTVHVLSYSTGHIDCKVETEGKWWRFTGFYGNPEPSSRKFSWTLLRRLAGMEEHAKLPWLVGGDFNEILSLLEKKGGNSRDFEQIDAFRRALGDCKLEDFMQHRGSFTWTNKRKGSGEILARLDRFVATPTWLEAFAKSSYEMMDEYGSDHRALLLKMQLEERRRVEGGHKRFHFEQKWFLDESFTTDFLMEWEALGGEELSNRLKISQSFLSKWAGSRFDEIGKHIKSLRKERVTLLNMRRNRDVEDRLAEISKQLQELTLKEEIHWRQRSRVNWLAHGDRNTRYFHNYASKRRKRNTIKQLRRVEGGEVFTEEIDMANVVMEYYGSLFQSSNPKAEDMKAITSILQERVPMQMEDIFDNEFSAEEVREALFQMQPTKAPGPDGFQPVFFQKLWGGIGKEVTRECLRVLNKDCNVEPWNETYISLIPKVDKPEMVRQFRPISLCNTIYKIVSKVVVNRLRRWMPFIIDESQSAFVPGRLISDNILLGFECMHWLRNQKSRRQAYVAAKLDMSKAYDRVEWPFLKLMMETLGFRRKIVRLIMSCVTTAKYSFVINGKVFGQLQPTRGLRQGDPLSPFLFVICSQGLSAVLRTYMDRQLYSGIRIARNAPMVSHLFFADDSLLFFNINGDGPMKIKEALDLYSRASGQCINYDKSALTFSPGASTEQKVKVTEEFGVREVQSHSIYLGLPTFIMKTRRLQFEYLAEKAAKKVGDWMSKTFSAGGKETLIKSVIQSIPTYTMSCFKIPVSTCNKIEKVCARFWWGDKEKERHMHWASWKELCKPKSRSGMGFRNLVDFNQALLAKQVWRLIRSPDTLVAMVLRAKYFPNGDVMSAKLKSNCSFSWRSLIWGRDLLAKGIMWKVGNGRSVRVFEDAWLPSLPEGSTLSKAGGMGDVRVAELLDERGEWDQQKCQNILLPIECEEIRKLDKLSHEARDVRYWKFEQGGEYRVKSGYLVASGFYNAHEASSSEETTKWWKFIWSFSLPQRIKIFAWKAFRNFIPTEVNLATHHVPIFGSCSWCRKEWGSTEHALLYCQKVRHWWTSFDFWHVLKKWEGSYFEMIGGAMRAAVPREQFELWIVGMWLVWKALCAEKHKETVREWHDLRDESQAYIQNYRMAITQAARVERILPADGSRKWMRPSAGRYRLDVDYAVDEARGKGGVGAIARDSLGNILFALAKPVAVSSSILHGELKAIMHGICQCIEEGLSPLEIFTDSMLAVITVREEEKEASILYEDLFEFFAMVKELNVLSISHVRREANQAAHELACCAKRLVSTIVWHENWPEWLLRIVRDDG